MLQLFLYIIYNENYCTKFTKRKTKQNTVKSDN